MFPGNLQKCIRIRWNCQCFIFSVNFFPMFTCDNLEYYRIVLLFYFGGHLFLHRLVTFKWCSTVSVKASGLSWLVKHHCLFTGPTKATVCNLFHHHNKLNMDMSSFLSAHLPSPLNQLVIPICLYFPVSSIRIYYLYHSDSVVVIF